MALAFFVLVFFLVLARINYMAKYDEGKKLRRHVAIILAMYVAEILVIMRFALNGVW